MRAYRGNFNEDYEKWRINALKNLDESYDRTSRYNEVRIAIKNLRLKNITIKTSSEKDFDLISIKGYFKDTGIDAKIKFFDDEMTLDYEIKPNIEDFSCEDKISSGDKKKLILNDLLKVWNRTEELHDAIDDFLKIANLLKKYFN